MSKEQLVQLRAEISELSLKLDKLHETYNQLLENNEEFIALKIKYQHFVKINFNATHSNFLKDSMELFGKYEFDLGGWRDRVTHPQKGIEFEFKKDAEQFISVNGGTFAFRK